MRVFFKESVLLIILFCLGTAVMAQQKTEQKILVRGLVTDQSTGLPVEGVSVTVKGETKGVNTNQKGLFSISVAPNAVLEFNHISFEKKSLDVQNRVFIPVSLSKNEKQLDEVVVVGYGTQKKADITGAINTVKGADLTAIPSADLSGALRGAMLNIGASATESQGGNPGGYTPTISIRKSSTYSTGGSGVLFVIDDVVGEVGDQTAFDMLDPSEVESITVLKDAAAAVYGVRAANGVIVVKTKRGDLGKPKITYAATFGMKKASTFPKMMNAYQIATYYNDYYDQSHTSTKTLYYTADELAYFKTHSYNWLKEAWQDQNLYRHTLNVSGGMKNVRYFFGGNYYNENGNLPKLYYRKYALVSNIDADITKDLSATISVNTSVGINNRPYDKSDQTGPLTNQYQILLTAPAFLPYQIDGYAAGSATTLPKFITNSGVHPYALYNSVNTAKSTSNSTVVNAAVTYKVPFVKGLSAKLNFSKTQSTSFTKQYLYPYYTYAYATSGTNGHIALDSLTGSTYEIASKNLLYESYTESGSYQLNAGFNYDKQFGKNTVAAMFNYEQNESTGNTFYGQGQDLIANVPQLMYSNQSELYTYGSGSESGRLSYVGRINWNYDNIYLVELSVRREASVKFAPARRWGTFPALSLGWRISREKFFENLLPVINDLKLRGSIGKMGADGVGGWQWTNYYSLTGSAAEFGGLTSGIQPGVVPNKNLTWEKNLATNFGLDASMLNDKLQFTFDIYRRHSWDILTTLTSATPTVVGATMPSVNDGKMNSYGIETNLVYNGNIGKDFRYGLRVAFGYSWDKVVYVPQSSGIIGTWQDQNGKNSDQLTGYIADGILRTQADVDKLLAKNPNYTIFGAVPTVGMLNYKDVHNDSYQNLPDGVIDSYDQTIIAKHSGNPYGSSFGVHLNWKGLDFTMLVNANWGGHKTIESALMKIPSLTSSSYYPSLPAFWADHWTPTNTNAKYPSASSTNEAAQTSTFWMYNAATVQIRMITLSYAIPTALLKKYGIGQCRLFFTGDNLWYLMKDKMLNNLKDPGVSLAYGYPGMRNYSLGLNLGF